MTPTPQTIARTVVLALALINQCLTTLGYSPLPFDDQGVDMAVSTAFTTITALVAWWKNNSFTRGAIEADNYAKHMKRGE